MADSGDFFLCSKGVTLGTVVFEKHDWPWNFGRFIPSAEFSNYEPVFTAAIAARRAGNTQEKDDSIRRIIDMELKLIRCVTNILAGEPDLLWIDGDRINWRGSDGILRKLRPSEK
jgi:hypothetical protein